jgi:hypothetical protein
VQVQILSTNRAVAEETLGFPLYLSKDNIVFMITIPVVVMVPLLSLHFVFTKPLHFLWRKELGNKLACNLHYLCLKPPEGIPIASYQIWSKHGENGVKMKEEQAEKQADKHFSLHR